MEQPAQTAQTAQEEASSKEKLPIYKRPKTLATLVAGASVFLGSIFTLMTGRASISIDSSGVKVAVPSEVENPSTHDKPVVLVCDSNHLALLKPGQKSSEVGMKDPDAIIRLDDVEVVRGEVNGPSFYFKKDGEQHILIRTDTTIAKVPDGNYATIKDDAISMKDATNPAVYQGTDSKAINYVGFVTRLFGYVPEPVKLNETMGRPILISVNDKEQGEIAKAIIEAKENPESWKSRVNQERPSGRSGPP